MCLPFWVLLWCVVCVNSFTIHVHMNRNARACAFLYITIHFSLMLPYKHMQVEKPSNWDLISQEHICVYVDVYAYTHLCRFTKLSEWTHKSRICLYACMHVQGQVHTQRTRKEQVEHTSVYMHVPSRKRGNICDRHLRLSLPRLTCSCGKRQVHTSIHKRMRRCRNY
jgi:hypothetical protein